MFPKPVSAAVCSIYKMSVVDLDSLSNDDLKKRVASLVALEDWSDECGRCGRPSLLHRDGPCTRKERELPEVVNKIWSDLRKRVKPILATLKADFRKEAEQSVLLDGLQRLITQVSGQNVDNMNRYTENMTTLVTSLKDTFTKEEAAGVSTAGVTTSTRVTKLTKPAKVPSWTKDMTLETYAKQLQTWTDILEDIPEFIKFQDLV